MRFTYTSALLALPLSLLTLACGDDDGDAGETPDASVADASVADASDELPVAAENWDHDIASTDLALDLGTGTATAVITTTTTTEPAVSFEIGDLAIARVYDEAGDLDHAVDADAGRLDVGVRTGETTLSIDYSFVAHENFDGWMPESGVSFLWPTFCGNLFPCVSNPADGMTVTASVTGQDEGLTAVYPSAIPAEAPSYMFAVAVAPFEEITLGTTAAGTEVKVWHLPGQETAAADGTENLVAVFDFFETTYGDYLFGDTVGTVSADWGGGDFGGMEHHPFWHVSSGSLYSEEVNAHEAAHGWYGDGVRIECWEDFVLSEGVVTYMAARALAESGVDLWPSYASGLASVCSGGGNTVVLPDATCNEIDILEHPLWSTAPYMKGAYFFRAVAEEIGEDTLDAALAEFYEANKGQAARMQELIDLLETKGDAEAIDQLVTAWLRTEACPAF